METKTVKQFLRSYLQAQRRYNSIMMDIEAIETQLHGLSIDYTKERVQTSPDHDKFAKYIDRLSALHKRAVMYAEESTRNMEAVFEAVQKVENCVLHELLSRRYIRGQSWEKIAVEMNYDYRHILRLHSQALEEVKKHEFT